jgi:hypothetical protein
MNGVDLTASRKAALSAVHTITVTVTPTLALSTGCAGALPMPDTSTRSTRCTLGSGSQYSATKCNDSKGREPPFPFVTVHRHDWSKCGVSLVRRPEFSARPLLVRRRVSPNASYFFRRCVPNRTVRTPKVRQNPSSIRVFHKLGAPPRGGLPSDLGRDAD